MTQIQHDPAHQPSRPLATLNGALGGTGPERLTRLIASRPALNAALHDVRADLRETPADTFERLLATAYGASLTFPLVDLHTAEWLAWTERQCGRLTLQPGEDARGATEASQIATGIAWASLKRQEDYPPEHPQYEAVVYGLLLSLGATRAQAAAEAAQIAARHRAAQRHSPFRYLTPCASHQARTLPRLLRHEHVLDFEPCTLHGIDPFGSAALVLYTREAGQEPVIQAFDWRLNGFASPLFYAYNAPGLIRSWAKEPGERFVLDHDKGVWVDGDALTRLADRHGRN